MANEVLHGVKKSGKNGFIMKVDFHKAFDVSLLGNIWRK
jgi:hypothetical protein